MSQTPIFQQDKQQDLPRQGSSQYPLCSPIYSQSQPTGIVQAGPASQEHHDSVQRRTTLILAAARLAEDAAASAAKAADMARQAAEMVSQATKLPLDNTSMTSAVGPFLTTAFGNTGSAHDSRVSVPPPHQRQIDHPMESYQSQFSVAAESGSEKKKTKRKAKAASGREASGDGSIDPQAMPGVASNRVPGPGIMAGHGLADYEMQLKLLEEANKRRRQ